MPAVDVERTRVLLDPSLLLGRSVLEETLIELPSLIDQAGFDFFVAASLRPLYNDRDAYGALPEFFESAGDFVDPDEVLSRLAAVGVSVWERPRWGQQEFAALYDALGEEVNSGMIQDVLFDEWFFLTHESWIVSRIKAPFQAMARAGEAGIELLNPIVRKTLKEDTSDLIQTADRMRALGKWIAVGGPLVAGLLNPIVGLVAGAVGSGFLLLDPPEEG